MAATVSGDVDVAPVQRRTLRILFVVQIISGVGNAIGSSVGALLAADWLVKQSPGLYGMSDVLGL